MDRRPWARKVKKSALVAELCKQFHGVPTGISWRCVRNPTKFLLLQSSRWRYVLTEQTHQVGIDPVCGNHMVTAGWLHARCIPSEAVQRRKRRKAVFQFTMDHHLVSWSGSSACCWNSSLAQMKMSGRNLVHECVKDWLEKASSVPWILDWLSWGNKMAHS